MESPFTVFAILGIAIVALGIHLFLYSKRQSRRMRQFAAVRGYPYTARDDGTVARHLEQAFRIEERGCVRAFGRLKDIVAIPNGEIFRTVELLDLNPHGSVQNSHHLRVGVRFSGLPDGYGIFHITPDLVVHRRYPLENGPGNESIRGYLSAAGISEPPCPLSLTIARGQALAYLEPVVVGSLAQSDLDYLAELAARLSRGDARPA
jgi:hypothetical protein